MLPSDTYRARLHETIAALRYWVPALRHVADVEDVETEAYWRLAVRPRIAEACPFELILHSDQHYDLLIGNEIFERQPVESLAAFQPLLEAIADGRVITRSWRTVATSMLAAVETIVMPAGGAAWRRIRRIASLAHVPLEDCQAIDRHYVRFARAD